MMNNVLIETQDGSHSLLSGIFGVSYHSRYGAIQESSHVFIKAGLHAQVQQSRNLHILEIGFGTGLNAYLTLLETERLQLTVHYEAFEAYPISVEQAVALNYPGLLEPGASPARFLQLHETPPGEKTQLAKGFHLLKQQRNFSEIDHQQAFDLVYYDAFAPDAQPELWELPMFRKIYEALKPGGVMVTYCAKGYVKRNLKETGFQVEALPGPPGKREMTRCVKV